MKSALVLCVLLVVLVQLCRKADGQAVCDPTCEENQCCRNGRFGRSRCIDIPQAGDRCRNGRGCPCASGLECVRGRCRVAPTTTPEPVTA
uniref:U8-Austrotoxin-Ht1a_1 n=1 Tax=Hickmania troglodytes TaxID=489260 RepID=A0A482ZFQ1_9ARAC